jgi:methylmalonyl-CoA mutase N-terminal domain/subunit
VDDRVVGEQHTALAAIRQERNAEDVSAALSELMSVAQSDGDLMPPILRTVKAYATTGEICGVLREVFGEYEPPTVI